MVTRRIPAKITSHIVGYLEGHLTRLINQPHQTLQVMVGYYLEYGVIVEDVECKPMYKRFISSGLGGLINQPHPNQLDNCKTCTTKCH